MNKKVFTYIVVGIVLVAGYLATGTYGLTKQNKNLYQEAVSLQSRVDKFGFTDFRIEDYPVAFSTGDREYVIFNGNMSKRNPILPQFAATAYKVDEHYEILVPTLEKFGKLVNLMNGAASFANRSLENADFTYSRKEHIATIWHEAFHAYQMTRYFDAINRFAAEDSQMMEHSLEEIVSKEIDANDNLKSAYEQELVLLKNALESKSVDDVKSYVLEYSKLQKQRQSLLSKAALKAEQYYETVEGTACYVESLVYQLEYDDEHFYNYYVKNFEQYKNGSSKYYSIGMAKCRILDMLGADWKGMDYTMTLDDLLIKQLGEEE